MLCLFILILMIEICIAVLIILHLLEPMYKVNGYKILLTLSVLIFVMLYTSLLFLGITAEDKMRVNSYEYEIYEVNAPHGRYWTETNAKGWAFGFLMFSAYYEQSSSLRESYTVKYHAGTELKTLVIDSMNPYFHVHFINGSENSRFVITHVEGYREYKVGEGESKWETINYNLYIPDPKLMKTGE